METKYRAVAYPASAGVEIQEVTDRGEVVGRADWIEATIDTTDALEWITATLEGSVWSPIGAFRTLKADDVNSIEDGWSVPVDRRPFAPRDGQELELHAFATADAVKGEAVHRPMDNGHREALIQVARAYYEATDPDADLDGLADSVELSDGDLTWTVGGGLDLLFTVIRIDTGEYVRAMSRTTSSWRTDADWPVTSEDHTATARTIWQLILAATW